MHGYVVPHAVIFAETMRPARMTTATVTGPWGPQPWALNVPLRYLVAVFLAVVLDFGAAAVLLAADDVPLAADAPPLVEVALLPLALTVLAALLDALAPAPDEPGVAACEMPGGTVAAAACLAAASVCAYPTA